jgi:hypothetical protein
MDTDATGLRRELIRIAILAETRGMLFRNWDKIFHGNPPSKLNVPIRERKISFQPTCFRKRKKILNPTPSDRSIDLFFPILLSYHDKPVENSVVIKYFCTTKNNKKKKKKNEERSEITSSSGMEALFAC